MQYTECGIEEMLSLVSRQEYDLGFLFLPQHKKSALFHMLERRHMDFVPLYTADLVLHVGRNHPLYQTPSIAPERLSDLEFVQLEDDFFAAEDLLQGGKVLNRVVRTNSSRMMIYMLEHTKLCDLGSFWLKDMFRRHDFGRIVVEGFQGKVSFGYVRRSGCPLRAREKEFLEFLRDVMRQDG